MEMLDLILMKERLEQLEETVIDLAEENEELREKQQDYRFRLDILESQIKIDRTLDKVNHNMDYWNMYWKLRDEIG